MKIKFVLVKFLSQFGVLDSILRRGYRIVSCNLYRVYSRRLKVQENLIVMESFSGKNICDSPFALYEELKKDRNLKFIWVVNSTSGSNEIIEDPNTKFVKFKSREYFSAYARAKYWISNCRLPYEIHKKNNQIYIQCWHGTPLKKIGCDINEGLNKKVSLRALKASYKNESKRLDYFLSPSKFSSTCFSSSFRLDNQKIVEVGYPRNDSLVNRADDKYYLKKIRNKLNIPEGKKIVLYAPTWRDNNVSSDTGKHMLVNLLEHPKFLDGLDDFVFLYRGHYFTHLNEKASEFKDVSDYNDVNDLMLVSDLLITDYSSLFFDYAILNRPILFFMPDFDEYSKKNRGFYLDVHSELPGKICYDVSTLRLNLVESSVQKVSHDEFNLKYNPYEDGSSSHRVIKKIGICNE